MVLKFPDRADRSRAGRTSRLLPARELRGFSLADDRVDVRGWQVDTRDEECVGTVDALFVDIHDRSVRYLGVRLARSGRWGAKRRVLVPVGLAYRPADRQAVVLDGITAAQLHDAPRLAKRPVTRFDEDAALTAYGLPGLCERAGAELYRDQAFDERALLVSEQA